MSASWMQLSRSNTNLFLENSIEIGHGRETARLGNLADARISLSDHLAGHVNTQIIDMVCQ